MGEINWALTLLISLVLSIPAGIFTNLITPKIQDQIEKRALSTQYKRLERLRKELKRVEQLHDNIEYLNVSIARHNMTFFIQILNILLLMLAVMYAYSKGSDATVFNIVILILIAATTSIFFRFRDDLSRLSRYEEYKKDALEQIKKIESEQGLNKDHRKSRRKF